MMTANDWKDEGINPELGAEWIDVMNKLNKVCLLTWGRTIVKNEDNSIKVKLKKLWTIQVNFVNDTYLEMQILIKDDQIVTVKHTSKNSRVLVAIMLDTLKYLT
ncbi:hypothetical protein NBRC110019_07700 [Neptunitalea chrysea]|uniref:Uncharacterized protein n=1 Tax=Neptunitalea chrysea TaxID=1647581 RepID=A0A9W6B3F9_9FLAO|nr:hypothetical protein [Neptunitalea chrysea]GLB51731.1 hypothetical protein NBRC110019_07700 [Neptunitalea chrysea]